MNPLFLPRLVRSLRWPRQLGIFLLAGTPFLAQGIQDSRTLRPQQASVQPAAPEARTALVIGNGAYRTSPLKNPVQDAKAMAEALQKCGFRVTLLEDATRMRMVEALRDFGLTIQGGGVGLFYFAGHGLQVKGKNYLVPVDADLASEDEVPYSTLDADAVLAKMETARNRLNILILDACRNNPFGSSSRGFSQGLAQMDAPAGSYIAFATAPGRTAEDGTGSHGLYTQYLLAQMAQPGLRIEDVFKRVRVGVMRDSKEQQVPWESSSITGDFYFVPGSGPAQALSMPAPPVVSAPVGSPPGTELRELKRDGRFIAYDNWTVLDTSTNLMWAARDNGLDIDWPKAKAYCASYRRGGYADWRLPTQDELAGLYDANHARPAGCGSGETIGVATECIELTCIWFWSSTEKPKSFFGYDVGGFSFASGHTAWLNPKYGDGCRVLPVRTNRPPSADHPVPSRTAWRTDLAGLQMAMLGLLDPAFTRDKAPAMLLASWREVENGFGNARRGSEPSDPDFSLLRQFAATEVHHWSASAGNAYPPGHPHDRPWTDEFSEIQVLALIHSNLELDETALSAEAAVDCWNTLASRLAKAPPTPEVRGQAYWALQKRIMDKQAYWTNRLAQEVAGGKP